MDNAEATAYLESLIGKTLRIRISDRRLFVGSLKCTDRDRNIILANTQEYREPDEEALAEAMDAAAISAGEPARGKAVAQMTSRFVGLIVVPGEHVRRIELEEFDASSLTDEGISV